MMLNFLASEIGQTVVFMDVGMPRRRMGYRKGGGIKIMVQFGT